MGELGDNAIAVGAIATVIGAAFGAPTTLTVSAVPGGDDLVGTFAAS
jgi:hypothetical protein